MKKLYVSSWGIFIAAFTFILLDYPGGVFFLLVSCVSFLIYTIILLFSKQSNLIEKLRTVSWFLLLVGLFFKIQYYPGAPIIIILCCLLQLVLCIITAIEFTTKSLPFVVLQFVLFTWTIYLLFRIQYWPFAQFIFILAMLITIIYFILHIVYKVKTQKHHFLALAYFIFTFTLSFTATHRVYYYLNANILKNVYGPGYSYRIFDKYSWFLYIDNKYNEALIANSEAQKALESYLKYSDDKEAQEYQSILINHENHILEKDWNDFP